MNNKLTPEESFNKLANDKFIDEVKNWLKIDFSFSDVEKEYPDFENVIGIIKFNNDNNIELRVDNSINKDKDLSNKITLMLIIVFYCNIHKAENTIIWIDNGIINQLKNNDISEYACYVNKFLNFILE